MTAATIARRLLIPPWTPMKRAVERIGAAMDDGADIVEVRGFPVRCFCVRDPDLIAEILKDPEVGETKYPPMLPRVRWVMGGGAYIRAGGDEWRAVRQQVQQLFKRGHLQDCAAHAPSLTEDLVASWRAHAASGAPFDAFRPLQLLVTRLNLAMFFSATLDEAELLATQERTHFVDLNFVRPLPLAIPTPSNRRFKRDVEALRALVRRLIAQRRAHPIARRDLLGHLLDLKGPDGRPWSDDAILGEAFSVYFGASVMGTTLAWTLSLVAAHPDIGDWIGDEATEAYFGRAPNPEDLPALPRAAMALREAMRLYPPSWGYPRWSAAGMTLGGRPIPARSLVIPMIWLAHRDPYRWPDPTRFRPQRFDPQAKAEIHPFSYLPFGSGPRTCLGAGLAPMVMTLILSQICRTFRLRAAPRFDGDPIADFGFEVGSPGTELEFAL